MPRSLLPGARSSRLRDRQKEERELLVKKAFVEDILKENNILSVLLGRQSTFNAVLWNADLLPCQSKESQMPPANETVSTTPGETVPNNPYEKHNDHNNLLDEMNVYMEALNDPYMGDDDISRDFHIDSGALACVACGILGFPFMSVVQLSERASIELLADLVKEGPGVSELKNTHHHTNLDGSVKSSVSGILPPTLSDNLPSLSAISCLFFCDSSISLEFRTTNFLLKLKFINLILYTSGKI